MSRFPYAAKTLADQVRERYGRNPDSEAGKGTMEAAADPDGFGVVREVKFDRTSSKWLTPLLKEAHDPRIVDMHTTGGRLVVTFASGIEADRRDRFPLDAASVVVGESEEQGEGEAADGGEE